MVAALLANAKSPVCSKDLAKALSNVCRGSLARKFQAVEAGAVSALVQVLEAHVDYKDKSVCISATDCLRILSRGSVACKIVCLEAAPCL